jgi:hypothetical protein
MKFNGKNTKKKNRIKEKYGRKINKKERQNEN